jgi:hypothetical protein
MSCHPPTRQVGLYQSEDGAHDEPIQQLALADLHVKPYAKRHIKVYADSSHAGRCRWSAALRGQPAAARAVPAGRQASPTACRSVRPGVRTAPAVSTRTGAKVHLDRGPVSTRRVRGLLAGLPDPVTVDLIGELAARGPAYARLPDTWPGHPDAEFMRRRSLREVVAARRGQRAGRRAGATLI